jgi:hypothetical protein
MTSAYPLQWPDGWKRTPVAHRAANSRFKTTFTKARADLFLELDRLGATNAVVSSWLPLRNDGLPRADAARSRLSDPGVAVYFTYLGKQMVMARDVFDSVHDNLRSIGLAIEHLRGLDRHGGATMMERAFEGFQALPAPGGWRDVLGDHATVQSANVKYRDLSFRLHNEGGNEETQRRYNAAIEEARKELGNG